VRLVAIQKKKSAPKHIYQQLKKQITNKSQKQVSARLVANLNQRFFLKKIGALAHSTLKYPTGIAFEN
jgi:hypothetical protein